MSPDFKIPALSVVVGLMFVSPFLEADFRRTRLRGLHVNSMLMPAYYLLCATGVASFGYASALAVSDRAHGGRGALALEILKWIAFLFYAVSAVASAIARCRFCSSALSQGELEDLRIEEAIHALAPLKDWSALAILATFLATFFCVMFAAPLCLGQGWETSYAFMVGWTGWLAGIASGWARVTTGQPRRLGLLTVLFLGTHAAAFLAYFEQPMGVALLWLIGLISGGAFAALYIHVQAGSFMEKLDWITLFQIPDAAEFRSKRNRIQEMRLPAAAIAERKSEADFGDVEAQVAFWSLYRHGPSILADRAEACKWCLLAACQGNLEAIAIRDQLPKFATASDIEESKRRAAQFVSKGNP